MTQIDTKQKQEILRKQNLLNSAKKQLKKEFIGLDDIIDEIIVSISSWFLFPDLQEKPVVVNLWGLTGTGKSSLVNRLVSLVKQEDIYFKFDSDDNNYRGGIKRTLQDIYENENGFPIILALDEFQLAKTIDSVAKELNRPNSIIWELLNSGKFKLNQLDSDVNKIYDLIYTLKFFVKEGVKVSKGRVVSRKIFFAAEMESKSGFQLQYDDSNSKEVRMVSSELYDTIFNLTRDIHKNPFEVREELMQLDGDQTIEYLEKILKHATRPKIVDCSKAIIFVIGNLDEAYTMSKNYNPDISADEFHELSLKINIPDIKQALKRSFRNEQIARLGNTHIIYPAFSSDSFKKIIALELNKITERVFEYQGIKLEFDNSINELIYKEGVYPAQGTRPVFTTIHQIINTKLAKIISEMILNNVDADTVRFKFIDHKILMSYMLKRRLVYQISQKQKLTLQKLRESKNDDRQAITAVHESGHAICSVFLMNTLPEVAYSITTKVNANGFVYTRFNWKYISRKEILNRIATFLGGYMAEKIIFGDENITASSESDIENATVFASEMLKNCGMGLLPAKYQVKDFSSNLTLHDIDNVVNDNVKELIWKAADLAEGLLKKQKVLLLQMANYLSDNGMMEKELIEKHCNRYGTDYTSSQIIRKGDLLFYRNHLKKEVLEMKLIED